MISGISVAIIPLQRLTILVMFKVATGISANFFQINFNLFITAMKCDLMSTELLVPINQLNHN